MLLLLNGPPGVGKSTLARLLVAERPGWLSCDIDMLRTLVGGWEDDFVAAGAIIRPVAKAMIGAHLAGGHGVVLPQLLGDPDVVLAGRWRGRGGGDDAWAAASTRVLSRLGGEEVVLTAARRVRALSPRRRPGLSVSWTSRAVRRSSRSPRW